MFSALRRRLSYANVAATLALALSMSGVAVAAHGYIVSSTGQLTNKVVKTIKHHGAKGKKGPNGYRGPTGLEGVQGALGVTGPQGFLGPQQAGPRGPAGPAGKERGPTGTAGAPGGATAIPFSAVLTAQALKEPVTKRLFSLPGGIEASLFCARIFFTLGAIDVAAPEGSVAETGSVEFNPEGERPLENARLNELMPLDPGGEFIATVISNVDKPEAYEANRAHITGSITTATSDLHVDAFLEVAPPASSGVGAQHRETCILHGAVAYYPT